MSDIKKRIRQLEDKVSDHNMPEFGTLEYLGRWLELSSWRRANVKKPELTTELLDKLIDNPKLPIVINRTPLPEMDEEENFTYPPGYGTITGEPIFVGLYSSSLLQKFDMTIYDLALLLQPEGGGELIDSYLGVEHPAKDENREERMIDERAQE